MRNQSESSAKSVVPIDPKKLPPSLRPIDPAKAGKRLLGQAEPLAHTVPTQKTGAFQYKDRFFATHEEAIEEKIAHFFRENHKSYIGVKEIAQFIREHIDELKKICAEKPE